MVAIERQQAERLGVKVGSTITFAAQDAQIVATVVALDQSRWAACVLAGGVYAAAGGAEGAAGGLVRRGACRSEAGGELQRALYSAYPTVTVINVAQALETVRAVVIQITYVIQFLAAFSIFAGVMILAVVDCGDAVPADSRGGGAEDAGRYAGADRDDLLDRVCGAGAGGGRGGDRVCECDCARAAAADDSGLSRPVVVVHCWHCWGRCC